ncbi:MAG: hypothetical protein KGV51_07765 [Moraxellaceae bacterium]|nr:hypothetical protein [Moraxellaceae bacterium]
MKKKILLPLLTIISILGLSACNFSYQKKVTLPTFNNNFQYKRLIVNKKNEAWIAGDKSIYYSSDGAVIRFNNGRFVGYSTPKPLRHWSEQMTDYVDWHKIAQGQSQTIKRCIVDHPKNQLDGCQIRVITPLINKVPKHHQFIKTNSPVQWIQENPVDKNYDKKEIIYYALDNNSLQPIYGQLYLDDNTQITWQDWAKK